MAMLRQGLPQTSRPPLPLGKGPQNVTCMSRIKITYNPMASSHSHAKDHRVDVRRQSYIEYEVFRKRWKKAVEEDKCWTDPYPQPVVESIYF
uniref:Uncharacterized protein n=1 Tax=Quercus lobata TaxID=97700 RepID=A0A7N2KQQ4_QUELO